MVDIQNGDIAEIVAACYSERVRPVVADAIRCYRTGAYRSCIISTWVAIVYDYVEKTELLAGRGVGWAKPESDRFQRIISDSDVQAAMDFEKDFLTTAQKNSLIITSEQEKLEALHRERNQCAHPSLNKDGSVYQPDESRARMHLIEALDFMLLQPPVGGGSALLDWVKALVDNTGFPTDAEHAATCLCEEGFFDRPADALLRRFTEYLVFRVLPDDKLEFVLPKRYYAALWATITLHEARVELLLRKSLAARIRKQDINLAGNVILLLYHVSNIWNHLDADIRQRILDRIRTISIDEANSILVVAWQIPELREVVSEWVNKRESEYDLLFMVEDEECRYMGLHAPEAVAAKAVEFYINSCTHDHAGNRTMFLLRVIDKLEPRHVPIILEAILRNSWLRLYNNHIGVMRAIRAAKIVSDREFYRIKAKAESKVPEIL